MDYIEADRQQVIGSLEQLKELVERANLNDEYDLIMHAKGIKSDVEGLIKTMKETASAG